MSRGLPFTRSGIFIVSALSVMAAAMILLAGCGGGEEDEFADQPQPRYMVPGQAADSAAADTAGATLEESTYVAGTLSDADGVKDSAGSGSGIQPEREAEIKATPAAEADAPVTATTRPAVSAAASNGDGAYNLQLGSFTNQANARQQADRISSLGYSPVIEETVLAGQTYHRVMLKGVGDMAEASRLGEHIHSELDIAYLVRRAK